MAEVKDYTSRGDDSHYNGVKSWYGDLVDEQYREQPQYCMPGKADGMPLPKGGNVQEGP